MSRRSEEILFYFFPFLCKTIFTIMLKRDFIFKRETLFLYSVIVCIVLNEAKGFTHRDVLYYIHIHIQFNFLCIKVACKKEK